MKHCPQCNLEFPDHFRFCGSCGKALTSSVRCLSCGELTDEKWPFCTYCGRKLFTNTSDLDATAPEATPSPRARAARLTTIPSPEHLPDRAPQRVEGPQGSYSNLYDEEMMTEAPVPESRTGIPQRASDLASETRSAPTLTILSAYGETEAPSEFRRWHGVVLGFLLLAFVSAVGIGSWYLWSQGRTVTQTSQASNSVLGPPAENSSNAPSYQPTSQMTPQNVPIASTADQEIERLREKRIGALPSEGVEIISALEQAEKRYPTDYRFPYELSKLSIKGIVSHHEAFEPLIRAAEKAIDNGQADEMLNSLMADKDGDFVKLSHGHHEWEKLEQALQNKDKGVLKVSAH